MNKLLLMDSVDCYDYEEPGVLPGFADKIIEFETLDDLLKTEFMSDKMYYGNGFWKAPFQKFCIRRIGILILIAKYYKICCEKHNEEVCSKLELGFLNEDIPELKEPKDEE